jgi:hypothetical protein
MLDAEQKMKLLISDRPWEHEPDNEEWVHELTGYKCTVWRHPTFGHLNGYVAIPSGHKGHGFNYDWFNDKDVEVHGGLTYSDEDKETGEWVVGFDCGHAGDLSPRMLVNMMKYADEAPDLVEYRLREEKYRTFDWVREEVCSLARQLKMLDMKPKGETK